MAGLIEALGEFKLKKGLILTEDEFDELKIDGRQINVLPVWLLVAFSLIRRARDGLRGFISFPF